MPRVESYEDAKLVPNRRFQAAETGGPKIYDGGVCDAGGSPVLLAQHRGGGQRNVTAPAGDLAVTRHLSGTWLFGGWYRDHFGHFVNESLGRLWAWPGHASACDGIVFLRYAAPAQLRRMPPSQTAAEVRFLSAFLRLAGIAVPALVVQAPHRVDRLIVPQQLALAKAEDGDTEGVRVHKSFLAGVAPDATPPAGMPVERIYVSRAGLSPASGRFILEDLIEENLRRAGYGILRPEAHPLEEQIAAYRAARILIFAEGSALHMAAPFLTPDKHVAILWRSGQRTHHMHNQIRVCGVENPLEFSAFTGFVYSRAPALAPDDEEAGAMLRRIALLPDFAALGASLSAAGLVEPGGWRVPSAAEAEEAVQATLAARLRARPALDHRFVASSCIPAGIRAKRVRTVARRKRPVQPVG